MKTKQAWKLPIVFLLGYVLAWGSILVDRQMIIDEQGRLQEEVNHSQIVVKITAIVDEYNEDYVKQIEWNEEVSEERNEIEKGRNIKGVIND